MWRRVRNWLQRRWQARDEALMFERRIRVTASTDGVAAEYPNGRREQIRWDEIHCVEIATNDTGPWGADFWYVLSGEQAEQALCRFPQGATGEQEAVQAIAEHCPGFDWRAYGEANGCTDNARFVCWQRRREGSGHPVPLP